MDTRTGLRHIAPLLEAVLRRHGIDPADNHRPALVPPRQLVLPLALPPEGSLTAGCQATAR